MVTKEYQRGEKDKSRNTRIITLRDEVGKGNKRETLNKEKIREGRIVRDGRAK